MHFALAVAIAVSFWNARHVTIPCQPIPVSGADALLQHDRFGNADAMAAASGCRILISRAGSWLRHDREMAPLYCADVAHEVGHLGGLPHSAAGLMADRAVEDSDIPWDCEHWRTYARLHGIPLRR